MPIFIVKNNLAFKNKISLSKEDEHHLIKVWRAKSGDKITLTDNNGTKAHAQITSITPLCFEITNKEQAEQPFPLTVYLPLIEQKRLEWTIEKLTELNITTIQLVATERSQHKDLSQSKIQRLTKISESAQKQCERSYPLILKSPISLKKTKLEPSHLCFYGTPKQEHTPPKTKNKHNNINEFALFVGPEGGWTQEEFDWLEKQAVHSITLGTSILRTETAALALTSIIINAYQ